MMLTHSPKPKACQHCAKPFLPARPMQQVCSPRCARKLGEVKKAKEKQALRERKKALETVPELLKIAQRSFNKWVRTRDHDQPCISCGAPPPDLSRLHAGRDAGHYRSVGSASHLRFHEDNCHAQCVKCNQWDAGKAVDYRIGLVARIGLEKVEALETNNTHRKWERDELRQIAADYKAKTKELEK
jgi:hypothetical protein